jgi:hypothetical protein
LVTISFCGNKPFNKGKTSGLLKIISYAKHPKIVSISTATMASNQRKPLCCKNKISKTSTMVIAIPQVSGMPKSKFRAKVLEVGKQEYQLETQFTFVSSKTESMGNKISINTQNCNQDENSKVLCSLVNKKFMVFLNHKGQVTKIENNKEILAQILKENQSENPLVKEGKIFDIYKEENIKAMFQNLFNFPLQNVKVGDTWMSNYTTKNGFELENKSKYTLVAANDKEFNINVQTNLTTTPHQKITNNGMEMIPNFTGSSNSEIILSKSSGWLIKSQSKSELKGDITVPSMNNMKIDMKSNIQSDLFPTSLPPSK